jgi:hypothetical protein
MFRSDVPEALERLIRQALEKDVPARPESAAEFRRALASFGSMSLNPSRPDRSSDKPLPLARRSAAHAQPQPKLALSEQSSRPPRGDE